MSLDSLALETQTSLVRPLCATVYYIFKILVFAAYTCVARIFDWEANSKNALKSQSFFYKNVKFPAIFKYFSDVRWPWPRCLPLATYDAFC